MKSFFLILLLSAAVPSFAQQHASEKALEARARELFRVIGSSDKAEWTKFVKENYSQALIDKPMRQRREQGEEKEETNNTATTQQGKLEEKAMMFQRLHEDFGEATLKEVKTVGQTCEMTIVASSGLQAVVSLKAESVKPWLLTGFGVEAHN